MRNNVATIFHISAIDFFTKSLLAVVAFVFALIVAALAVVVVEAVFLRVRRAYRTWKVRRFLRSVARNHRR